MLFNDTQVVISKACLIAAQRHAQYALKCAGATNACRKSIEMILDFIEIGQLNHAAESFLNMAALCGPKNSHSLDFCLDVLSQIKGGH
jgi:hypothetical protein